MDFAGPFYASNEFLRNISSLAASKKLHGLTEVGSEDRNLASSQLQGQRCGSVGN